MEKVLKHVSTALSGKRGFPVGRKSHAARRSLEAELSRLRRMTIEERVVEALSGKELLACIKPTPKDP